MNNARFVDDINKAAAVHLVHVRYCNKAFLIIKHMHASLKYY